MVAETEASCVPAHSTNPQSDVIVICDFGCVHRRLSSDTIATADHTSNTTHSIAKHLDPGEECHSLAGSPGYAGSYARRPLGALSGAELKLPHVYSAGSDAGQGTWHGSRHLEHWVRSPLFRSQLDATS